MLRSQIKWALYKHYIWIEHIVCAIAVIASCMMFKNLCRVATYAVPFPLKYDVSVMRRLVQCYHEVPEMRLKFPFTYDTGLNRMNQLLKGELITLLKDPLSIICSKSVAR